MMLSFAFPDKKELEVKNIQKNDVDVAEASCSDRVGLAIRKLTSNDVPRGSVLTKKELRAVTELENKIEYSKFSQKDSAALAAYHCLQAVTCKIDGQKIVFERKLALVPGQPIVFCDLNKKLRVVGVIRL